MGEKIVDSNWLLILSSVFTFISNILMIIKRSSWKSKKTANISGRCNFNLFNVYIRRNITCSKHRWCSIWNKKVYVAYVV